MSDGEAKRAGPGPCWECGDGGITLPDRHYHFYCGNHLALWDTTDSPPSPRQLRDAANGPWEGET